MYDNLTIFYVKRKQDVKYATNIKFFRHGLLILVEITSPTVETTYRGDIEQYKLAYLQCWGKFNGYLSNESRGVVVDAQPGVKVRW